MNRLRLICAAALAAGALLSLPQGAKATSDAKVLSPADQALFTADHLAAITEPSVLVYDFEKKGTLESGFTDTVEATIKAIEPDGHKDLSFHFLSGSNHLEFRDFEDYVGNPIFMLFLERDVRQMQDKTHGNALYFRNRIRNALAGSATMAPTTFDFAGAKHKGTEIRIQPYADDPMNERYPQFAKKTYIFILSDDVPGKFFKVSAMVPNPASDQPLTEESVTFHEIRANAAGTHAETGGSAAAGKAN